MSILGKAQLGAVSALSAIAIGTAAVGGALGLGGCTTSAYCFSECNSGGATNSAASGMGSDASSGGDIIVVGAGGGSTADGSNGSGASTASGCSQTNGGLEVCDGIDNDCNGKVDDVPGLNPKDVKTCGTCNNNCQAKAINCDPAQIGCSDTGVCTCGQCAADYFDLDKNGSCEYYCVKDTTVTEDTSCNNKDDDCNGVKDDKVDFCGAANCGKCGNNCVVLHGTPKCVGPADGKCTAVNTQCAIAACDCTSIDNCWHDLDGSVATGCEYQCYPTGVEICGDGIDNDCDGKIDEADDLSGDPQIGQDCFGAPDGECAKPGHGGKTTCKGNKVVCEGPNVLHKNDVLETCNDLDDNCDGLIDNNPVDAGMSCGVSNQFPCSFGTITCVKSDPGKPPELKCIGATDPGVEVCNNQDDDCDGTPDKTGGMPPSDSVGPCNEFPAPPAGATSPCKAGVKACVSGTVQCLGSAGPISIFDTCGVDANCDGKLDNQPDLKTDIHNCGTCGKDCLADAVHANFTCVNGSCQFQSCQSGFFDLDGDKKCEYACIFLSSQESCNGLDDNCDGTIDEAVILPSPTQVCGVNPAATRPECTTGVSVACKNGAFQCTFPAGVCTAKDSKGKPSCLGTAETCDGIDNNCNGLLDENVPNIGAPCASDDGKPSPGDGVCRGFGAIVCNGLTAGKCNAVKNNGAAGAEVCDGLDNDCDGLVDEPFTQKGTNTTFFVKPAVTKISTNPNLWVMSYEASRPTATAIVPGTGNGFFTSAPAGTTLDKTPACSAPNKIPWFNVTGAEVEQTCTAMGGRACTLANWQLACRTTATPTCKWGYAPRGTACTSVFQPNPPNNPGKFCNLGISFDFSSTTAGDQDGLLPSGSPLLSQCFADWVGIPAGSPNAAATGKIFDITGNLREIVKVANNQYDLMGGAFDSQSEDGSSCDFTFYAADQNFKFFDTGFRCCFDSDPTL